MTLNTYIPNTNWIDMTDVVEALADYQYVRYTKGHIKCGYCGEVQYLLYEKFYCPNCGKYMIKDAYEKGGEN